MCLSGQESETINTVLNIFSSPTKWRNLWTCSIASSPLQSGTCVKDRAAFVRPIWKERGQPAEAVRRRKGVDFAVHPSGSVHGPRICCCGRWSAKRARAAYHLQQAQAWTLDLYPYFSSVLKAVFVPFFPLNTHHMVVINTLGEGQGFKTEENTFHKNIKNGKKVTFFKNLLYKPNGSCWKSH